MCFKAHLFRVWLYSSVYSIHNFSHDELWSTYEVLINWRTVGVKNVLKMDIISGLWKIHFTSLKDVIMKLLHLYPPQDLSYGFMGGIWRYTAFPNTLPHRLSLWRWFLFLMWALIWQLLQNVLDNLFTYDVLVML
jgi:hypothetical protein